jgi:hypothetical protein
MIVQLSNLDSVVIGENQPMVENLEKKVGSMRSFYYEHLLISPSGNYS